MGPLLYQAHCPLPVLEAGRGQVHACISVWMVGGEPAGISFRESRGPVTGAAARVVPHILRG
jgi:glutathionylspermidine synthase